MWIHGNLEGQSQENVSPVNGSAGEDYSVLPGSVTKDLISFKVVLAVNNKTAGKIYSLTM